MLFVGIIGHVIDEPLMVLAFGLPSAVARLIWYS
jgi:hypothetical protein